MVMDICYKGKFSLRYKSYLGDHKYTTHDIEIVKWSDNHCYTIACWNEDKDPDLVSCGLRLLDEIETIEDLQDVKHLATIGLSILLTDKKSLKEY